ncbi:MAG TPA: polysaccharide ABC transporter ATP-binding protein [Syntrophales bacterium]|nr:polysaccharide ABC transporter ATP-binding protein [Syntrophales bacterium]HPX12251.1 polysaccharide ABC transporter ATP-binding protein [Syntrophales bacterium]HQB30564.1 polysaccharide ABC transporter ATP-binding protein [Syntrophales bacterium]HQN77058.1 polysaccharide ABC transporter ATP-binding protein [Syntrophales bacterium]HQQ26173.1 polysaccharide ABC transporter ATP-binding protein [Syntrophales bacterium]
MKPVIESRSVTKKYQIAGNLPAGYRTLRESLSSWFRPAGNRKEFTALDEVSFDVLPGERWGIIGENGAGKTTLLKIIARITPPTKGSLVVRGRVASLLEVGTGFHPELTGRENIFLNGSILGLSRREIQGKFDEIVAFSEVENFLDTPVKHYSTGMWARLAFSVAAHLEPEILLVDEVLSVGDADFQDKSLRKMSDVSEQGRTILFVSHNMPAVRRLCTRCLWIGRGKIRRTGTPDEVIDAYRSTVRDDSPGFADLASVERRRGTQEIRLARIELKNRGGETTGTYAIGDDLNIHLFLEPRRPLKKVKIIVGIEEPGGERLCTMYENDSGFSLKDVSLPVHVSLGIGDLRFCPGRYLVTVLLCSEIFNYTCDVYDDPGACIGFTMVNNCVTNRALMRQGGLLYLTPRWEFHGERP